MVAQVGSLRTTNLIWSEHRCPERERFARWFPSAECGDDGTPTQEVRTSSRWVSWFGVVPDGRQGRRDHAVGEGVGVRSEMEHDACGEAVAEPLAEPA